MRRVAIVLAAAMAMLPVAAAAQTAPSPTQRLAQLRHRVEQLEAQDEIENLQATFGYYFDKGLWSDVADLFAAQGTFEYGQQGVYVGRAHIARALLLFGPQGLAPGHLNTHMQLQGIVTVAASGNTATARWRGMVQLAEPGANGIWGEGVYENSYVREGGRWKIAALHFFVTGMTDYDLGWMKSAIPMRGPSALFPPDRPPSITYRAFPGT
ncbi:MAG TPA: nuclear transport factor 2 family protein, partial [Novosphingobium sp.]|nr:nuclear transport factor 2 family protein [Novosphingobium sp.]